MLRGIDVSHYNGLASAELLAQLDFAIVRATYGTRADAMYSRHTSRFRSATNVLAVGAYHFGVGWASPAAQVSAFLAAARGADFYVLDLERDTTKTMTRAQGAEFVRLLRASAPGKKILLYSSRGTWPGDLGQDENWVADYTGRPDRAGVSPRIPWRIWQWQGHPLDQNYFNGDAAAIRRLAGKAAPAPAPAPVPDGRVRVIGAFWPYKVSGTRLLGYRVTRPAEPKVTKGFTASFGTVVELTWAGRKRRLAKITDTDSAYNGVWVDLLDGPNVREV